jgi:hypothetical protein
MVETLEISRQNIFEGSPTKLKTILQDFSCVLGMAFLGFPVNTTNDVPTKLVAVMVTTQNYYYKSPVPKYKSKNILVEKKCNKPTDAQPIKKVLNKIVKRKKKFMASTSTMCGTQFHILHHQS